MRATDGRDAASGPGFDHGLFSVHIGPWLAAGAQVVYLDMRGAGRSDSGPPEEHTLERWAEDVHELCGVLRIERPVVLGLGFGTLVALRYAARHPTSRRRSSWRAGRPDRPRALGRDVRAARRGGGGRGGEALLRRDGRPRVHRLRPRLLSAPLELRDDERGDRPRSLEPGGADALDGRGGEDGRSPPRAAVDPRARARPGGRGRRVGAARVRARGRGAPARRPLPELRARAPLDLPGRTRVHEELRVFLDEVRAAEGMS